MNKTLQKLISLFLLAVFTCNTIIAPTIQAMAIPVAVMQQVPAIVQQAQRILLTAGSCIAGIVATQWATKKFAYPTNIKKEAASTLLKEPRTCKSNTINSAIDTVAEPIAQLIHQVPSQRRNARQKAGTTQCITPKSTIHAETIADSTYRTSSHKRQESTRQVNWRCSQARRGPTFHDYDTDPITRRQLPNGVEYANSSVSLVITAEPSDQITCAEATATYIVEEEAPYDPMHDSGMTQEQLAEAIRISALRYNLKTIVDCFINIESSNLIDRIQSRIALDNLSICEPYDDELGYILDELHDFFFHKDGTLCRAGVHQQTAANKLTIKLIDYFDEEMSPHILHQDYMSDQDYAKLQSPSLWASFTSYFKNFFSSTGYNCPVRQLSPEEARKTNAALQECINYCKDYDFKSAKELLTHDNTGLMKDIIAHYQNVKRRQHASEYDAQGNPRYDSQGILRIAHNDPLYKKYKQQLENLNSEQLKTVNENFAARLNVKYVMQDHWDISDAEPVYVHEALYIIMGDDCSNLADITLLQNCIDKIIRSSPEEKQCATLIKAFYNECGLLKEFCPQAKDVAEKLSLSQQARNFMRSTEAIDSRHRLNTLVQLRIKNPENAAEINTAIEYLGKSLNATTESERTDYKNKFDSIYFKFAEQPQQQKPNITPQDGNNPSPDGQKPDPDKKKNDSDPQKLATGIVAATIAETSGEETVEITEKVVAEVTEVVETVVKNSKLVFEKFADGRLEGHFADHVLDKAEWGKEYIMSMAEYLKKAQDLLNSPIGGDIEGFVSRNGYTFRYNVATNEFATAKPNGIIETLYRPIDGMSYWSGQILKYK